jgi:hypothetical protein
MVKVTNAIYSYNHVFIVGKFFFDWLKCYGTDVGMHNGPTRYPRIKLQKKIKHFEFIHPELRNFLLENKKNAFHIYTHHIVLRSITSDEDFKVLSQYGPDCGKKKREKERKIK